MKLMEECAGIGEIVFEGRSRPVAYRVQRHQGVMAGSGLPIPGLHRLEGAVTAPEGGPAADFGDWVGRPLTLKLDDGRRLGVTVVDPDGRILSEGHGPMRCLCC
jgi:hypothetical protein